jgi:hypothetical protein
MLHPDNISLDDICQELRGNLAWLCGLGVHWWGGFGSGVCHGDKVWVLSRLWLGVRCGFRARRFGFRDLQFHLEGHSVSDARSVPSCYFVRLPLTIWIASWIASLLLRTR